jgi:hypothetical protein
MALHRSEQTYQAKSDYDRANADYDQAIALYFEILPAKPKSLNRIRPLKPASILISENIRHRPLTMDEVALAGACENLATAFVLRGRVPRYFE